MNKVISINIGGSIFQVEEGAYEILNAYLNELKKHFTNKPEGSEIITDIENRIAELLRAKLSPLKAAINIDDVNEVTSSMGAPKDFAAEDDAPENPSGTQSNEKKTTANTTGEYQRSRVFRDPDARIVGGVCSGLGHYFKVDPFWIRLFFVIVTLTSFKLIFFGMSPVLVYIILWIIIPEANTTAEKLHMRKEQINIDNIQKSVQTEFGKVRDTMEGKDFQNKVTGFLRKFADFIRMIVLGAVNIIRKVAKIFFIFFGIAAIIVAISALTGKFVFNDSPFTHGVNIFHFFENNSDKLLAQATLFFGAGAVGLLLFTIANSLSKHKLNQKTSIVFRTSTIVISITAIVLSVFLAAKITSYFATSQKMENIITLDSSQHHFYIRNINPDHTYKSYSGFNWENFDEDTIKINDVTIIIEVTEESIGKLIETKISRGQNAELARMNAASILALSSANDSIINLSASFSLLNNQVYRKQELVYTLKLPVGTKFTIDDRMYCNIHIESENGDSYAHQGNTYTVTKKGIDCDDCTRTYSGTSVNTSAYPLNIPVRGHEFNSVSVSSNINCKIVRGDNFVIKARGTENVRDIEIEFRGSEVSVSDNRSWDFILTHKSILEIIIVMPELESLDASGSSDVVLDGFNQNRLKIELSGASTCKTSIDVEHLEIDMGGATNLHLEGKVKSFEAKVSGASKLHAKNIPVSEIIIDLSGASFAEVNCTDKLEAEASGASNLRYKGDVKNVISKNSGASSVEKAD